MSIQRHYAIRLFALTIVAWLAQTWWAGQRASASCGDYVTVGGVHGRVAAEMSTSARSSPTRRHGMPTCSGPQCQRNLPLPVTPKQVFPPGPHESAYSRAEAGLTRPERSFLISEPALLVSQAIFSPPVPPPRAF
ncbi:MAG TPA: hypothetical protein VG826_26455 [Pirellulales bacterium]|nr:hypothetical protein [Pirellulales bacterium]